MLSLIRLLCAPVSATAVPRSDADRYHVILIEAGFRCHRYQNQGHQYHFRPRIRVMDLPIGIIFRVIGVIEIVIPDVATNFAACCPRRPECDRPAVPVRDMHKGLVLRLGLDNRLSA